MSTPTPEQISARLKADAIHNQEFKITFSETNLRYLAGEPPGEHRDKCVAINRAGIADAQAEIQRLQSL